MDAITKQYLSYFPALTIELANALIKSGGLNKDDMKIYCIVKDFEQLAKRQNIAYGVIYEILKNKYGYKHPDSLRRIIDRHRA